MITTILALIGASVLAVAAATLVYWWWTRRPLARQKSNFKENDYARS
jgi:hypothetical protein